MNNRIITGLVQSHPLSGFIKSVRTFPNRAALDVEGSILTYKLLANYAKNISSAILHNEKSNKSLIALFAYRSQTAYAGVLGILASGRGYVPLNPKFPIDRTAKMLDLSGCNTIVVGQECIEELQKLLSITQSPMNIIIDKATLNDDLIERFENHNFVLTDIPDNQDNNIIGIPTEYSQIAYLLFTSGSTGTPKGVPVSHENVVSYITYTLERYDFNEQDRFSQTFDLTFDLSVHDMFLCWSCGACLCCIPENEVMLPAKFIREKKITAWFSVPSVAMFVLRMRALKPDAFPTLRYSLFCGEPLTTDVAENWQKAAPNSILENLYGPTEATIAITNYRWDNNNSIKKCVNGVVPIGKVFQGQDYCIIDHNLSLVPLGAKGELCLSGTQIADGYLGDEITTQSSFVHIPGSNNTVWYKTGDLVFQDNDGCLHYCGRIDNQVKILGYRVELQEIDSILRKASGSSLAVSIPWPVNDSNPKSIVGIISGTTKDQDDIINYCKGYLPPYMIPSRIVFLDNVPLNSNGKIDRQKLAQSLSME